MTTPRRYSFRFISADGQRSDFGAYDRTTNETHRLHLYADHTARLQTRPVPDDMLDAFNDWRQGRHDADMCYIAEKIDPAMCADYPFHLATHAA